MNNKPASPHPPLPRLRDIEAFATAAEQGSLGAAARGLRLSQPAVSQAIARLEVALAQTLLDRGPHGSFPSAAGARFLERCARMRRQLQAGLAACRSGADHRLLTDTAIETHLAIAEAGSFSAAARRRGVSLPTLARTAHALARGLGTALYRRGSAGIVATPGGLELARRFALARVEIEQGMAELAAASAGSPFRLGLLPMLPREPLARAIAQRAGVPGPTISARDGTHAELMALLRQGRLDAVLGALRGAGAEVAEEALRPDPFIVAAGAAHPLATTAPIPPEALAAAPWVVAEAPLPRREAAERLFGTLPRRPRILLETNAPDTTIALLREGVALALLAKHQVATSTGLVALPVAIEAPPRWIGLTLRRDWLPTPAQTSVLEVLRAAFAPNPDCQPGRMLARSITGP
jgi:DNA-binding transcriptional LysR family regulator